MKKFLVGSGLAAVGAVLVVGALATTARAQDENADERRMRMEERRLEMEQRRAEYLENNPDAAARLEERRRAREEFLAQNPEAAARMEERREGMRERFENGDGRPRGPRPEFDGRRGPPPGGPGPGFDRRREGAPPGGPRFGDRGPGRAGGQRPPQGE